MSTRFLYLLFAVLLTCSELSAKGGGYKMEDHYNPRHIDSLPPEIRSSILRRCNEPNALTRSQAIRTARTGSSFILSTSSAMGTVLTAAHQGACTKFGFWRGATTV